MKPADEPKLTIMIYDNHDKMESDYYYTVLYLDIGISCNVKYKGLEKSFFEDERVHISLDSDKTDIDYIRQQKSIHLRKLVEPKVKKWLEEQGWDNSLIYFNVSVEYSD